ncbi:3-alpha,7-alpha,12-alpha-trihydroxy-5-beta-choles t-24-enoyl-CoA hydratase [Rhizocola hellebori]|uniref:3-alpha,7-alpha,12-alpha-trihydroxy-5-beta-choles t-24-enoyl-CoA hydratase n=1 Tax=Rhizocola hellebori TaxID=1392758 RepID=A0A8J3QAV8_9ACTN|nr:MaoC/PaaZ C-terminal domain-containing protein [Rhizocola hellebori]GIH06246.1 3-alpha,7-alpha,12-alpha-trihydroxy-5-beta-choles t-24-enoyl-CoA hydratase [Rhizocola hellebori]
MPIDPEIAIGAALPSRDLSWNASDVLLYHLALGATDERLQYVYERDLAVLPTFAMVMPTLRDTTPPVLKMPGVDVDLVSALHGRQELTMHKPLPASGAVTATSRIADVYDKGSAAIIVTETTTEYFTSRISIFVKGEGGFGGVRGPSTAVPTPQRAPDEVLTVATFPTQALLYRLCGDFNPLHADPGFAAMAGFPKPILHGLCTYGMVCKAIVDHFCDGDVTRVVGYSTRFAGVVFPGETLAVSVWRDEDRLSVAATVIDRDHAPALDNALLTLA